MSPTDTSTSIPCPNCRKEMQTEDLERRDQGTVRVYLCYDCAGLWFDHLASVQLAPAAVIELFKQIHAHPDGVRQPAAKSMSCPRCTQPLALSFDLGKTGRFSYFSCHRGDGRFTPFLQFLREKQFVRNLTAPELARVRAEVRQITCSECGAPIDLEHDNQCSFCHAPISFLDPDAVDKAVKLWSEADHRSRLAPTPQAVENALLRSHAAQAGNSSSPGLHLGSQLLFGSSDAPTLGATLGPDLVALGISAIARLFEGRR